MPKNNLSPKILILLFGVLVAGCTSNSLVTINECKVRESTEADWGIDLRTEACIPAAIAAMTLREKIGQMAQTDLAVATPSAIREQIGRAHV